MSSRRHSIPQAIRYYEFDEFTKSRVVKGPINYAVFEKRYRSNEWPSIDHKTCIWNGTDFKQWTPIFSIDYLFKKLDPKKYRAIKEENNCKHNCSNINDNIDDNVLRREFCLVCLELLKWLIISRTFIFLLVFCESYISPFDSSNYNNYNNYNGFDKFCLKYLNCFSNWDSSHFLNIAQFGYQHEKMYAFYPGLPLIINSIMLFIRRFITKLHFKSMALLCGIIWNGFISSYLSSLILYYLTIKIYNKPWMAAISCKLFLINPASIFFISIYTESTFAFSSFLLMLCCELKYFAFKNNMILTLSIVLCLIIASSLRSNGIIMIGFPLFYHIYSNCFVSNNIYNVLSWIRFNNNNNININIFKLIGLIICLIIGLSPWFYYQYFCKKSLCVNVGIASDRAYCVSLTSTVYSFVQSNYWKCGWLKRWNINEIGNFILAAPIWFISFHAMRHYINQFIVISMNNTVKSYEIVLNHKLIPYIVYWCILWLICIFYAHVQISTRFICCSCPPLYWFCAQIIYKDKEKDEGQSRDQLLDYFLDIISQNPTPKLIISYFLLYFTIGTVAFCAYLPFV